MRVESLESGLVDVDDNLSIARLVLEPGHTLPETASHLRFLFSLKPLLLSSGAKEDFLSERSAVRVNPGAPVRVSAESGAELYVISFGMSVPEAAYLERLQSQHEGFFRSLEGDYRDEWDAVKDKPLDYVAAGERNAERMRRGMEGILVAPPDSRFTHPRSNGWHFMFTRGSRTLGFGSDVLYKLRSEEVSHSHRIIDEIYVGLGGGMSFEVDGREVHVGKGSVLISPPGERHKMRRLVEAPYYGFTLQTPSIPSDRILE